MLTKPFSLMPDGPRAGPLIWLVVCLTMIPMGAIAGGLPGPGQEPARMGRRSDAPRPVTPPPHRGGILADMAEWTDEALPVSLAIALIVVAGYAGVATVRARRGARALTALKESEERFAKAFRVNPAPVSIATVREGRLLDVNDRYLEFFGYAREEVIGRTVPELQMWANPVQRQSLVDQLMVRRSLRDYEAQLQRKDGGIRDVLLSLELIDYPGEAEPVLIAMFTDITDHRQIVTAVQAERDRLRQILDAQFGFVAVLTTEGRIFEINQAPLRAMGLARDAVLGRLLWEIGWTLPGAGPELAEIVRCVAQGQVIRRDLVGWLPTLGRRTADVVFHPLRDAAGAVINVIAFGVDITERKQAEEVLRQSREQFQRLFEASPLGTALTSLADGRFVDVNTRFLELGEFTRADVIGHTAHEINLWCDPAMRERLVDRARSEKVVRDFEARLRSKSGREYDVLLSAQVIELPAGPVLMVQSNDVTARKRAEEALREREARLRAIITAEPECVKVVALDGALLEMNAAGLKMLEVASLLEARSRPLLEWIAPDHRAAFQQLHQRVLRGKTGGLEFQIIGARGAQRWLETHAVPLRDAQGAVTALLGVTRDITEHRQKTEELRLSEARARALIDHAPEAIVVLDFATGRFVDFNPAAVSLFGHAPEELRRLGPLDVSPPVQPDGEASEKKAVKYLQQAADGDTPAFEWTHCHRDGRELPCEIRLLRLPARDHVLIRGSITDISERKRAAEAQARLEEQLRQLQKLESVGQLAGGVAHDFNNLLTVIQGNISLLQASGSLSDEADASLREVAQAAERAASLTRQLLAFSRRQVMQTRRVNLNEVVADMLKLLGRLLGETVAIHFDAAADLPPVQADAGMLEQVLMNLAVNARDALPQGGDLRIATSSVQVAAHAPDTDPEARPGPAVCLTVSDTGSGIPPELLPRIFEPFFTTKDVGKGTGLGLSTVFGIVKQHGGWIQVTSDVGRGTTFRIFLPAAEGEVKPAEAGSPAPAPRRGHETILVVEDEEALRTLMRRILEQHGYRVLLAGSGVAALELWPRHCHEIDLLVTDLVMPRGVNGRELAAKLIEQRPGLKVVYTTGYSADAAAAKTFFREGVNFVQKPFGPAALLETVRNCLDG